MLSFSLRKTLGSFNVDVHLESNARRVVLFGPSGSGKSVTLQCLAGLLHPDNGRVTLDQRTLFDSERGVSLAPELRHIGYVPQQSSLFPHMTVAENVAYGLRKSTEDERGRTVGKLLSLVRLDGFGNRRPHNLSGGEQQRIALARALAIDPRLMLLDEPFSALDAPVRASLRQELLELQNALGFAWVFVTHDLEEAYLLADDIAVYSEGRILQAGPRDEVLYGPTSVHVARLVGFLNIFPVEFRGAGCVVVQPSGQELALRPDSAFRPGGTPHACIRQEDIRIVRKNRASSGDTGGTKLTGHILEEHHLGFTSRLLFDIERQGGELRLWVDVALPAYRSLDMANDKNWDLVIPEHAVHLTSGPAPGAG